MVVKRVARVMRIERHRWKKEIDSRDVEAIGDDAKGSTRTGPRDHPEIKAIAGERRGQPVGGEWPSFRD